MTRSSQDIEREVEATRGDLDRTVEALKDKMSPGQIIDELTAAFKGSGSMDMVSNLGSQVRDNPLAVAMIGAGFAWLMMGDRSAKGASSTYSAMQSDMQEPRQYGEEYAFSEETSDGPGLAAKAKDAALGAASGVKHAAGDLKHKAADLAGQVKHGAQSAGSGAGALGRSAKQTFTDTLEHEPLIVAGLGLALGAALGAALPATALEDRSFGEARDRLVEKGREKAKEGIDTAKHAAAAAYDGVKDEADRLGLAGTEGGDSLVDKAEGLVRAGLESARADMEQPRQ